jgi:S1-C subfamily serine protease
MEHFAHKLRARLMHACAASSPLMIGKLPMKKSLLSVFVIAAIAVAGFAFSNRGEQASNQFSIEDSVQTTVMVSISDEDKQCWNGSGVLVGNGQYVITTANVITGGAKNPLLFPGYKADQLCNHISIGITNSPHNAPSKWITASVVESRNTLDLTLLKLEDVSKDELPSAIINFDELHMGTPIWTVGFPMYNFDAAAATATNGVINSFHNVTYGYQYGISTDVGCGSTGSPVFNAKGELVAIASLMSPDDTFCTTIDRAYAYESSKELIGWAKPIKFAQPLLDLIAGK